jgi:hypothetical protein
MESDLLQRLGNKTISKEEILRKLNQDSDLLPEVLKGTSSSKAGIRYGCGKVLMGFSEEHPEKLYPYVENIIELLNSKYRILIWNALAIIANLTRVDKDRKFDAVFGRYYSFLNDAYMVTVVNVVGNSAKIASAKPYLVQKITAELLKVDNITVTPHLTEECKRVIAEHVIKTFDMFFDKVEAKAEVFSFVRRQLDSPRASLRKEAESFLKKWA